MIRQPDDPGAPPVTRRDTEVLGRLIGWIGGVIATLMVGFIVGGIGIYGRMGEVTVELGALGQREASSAVRLDTMQIATASLNLAVASQRERLVGAERELDRRQPLTERFIALEPRVGAIEQELRRLARELERLRAEWARRFPERPQTEKETP